jgi:hypothetical protein
MPPRHVREALKQGNFKPLVTNIVGEAVKAGDRVGWVCGFGGKWVRGAARLNLCVSVCMLPGKYAGPAEGHCIRARA